MSRKDPKGFVRGHCPFRNSSCLKSDCVFYDEQSYCIFYRMAHALAIWAEAQP